MKLIKEFKQFIFESKRGKSKVDWNTYLVLFPYTKDDYDLFLSIISKRRREGNESLTHGDLFAWNKYFAAFRRKLIPREFITHIDWDTYFKESPFTPEDRKRYNSASKKRRIEGSESLTDDDLFAINKYIAYLRGKKLKKQGK